MGNAFVPPAAPLAPALVLEEEQNILGLLMQHLARLQVGNPQLRRMLSGSGSAAALCSTLRGGADGAGGCPRDGFNALHVAVAVGWLEMVERLLLAGVIPINAPSREGYTPLMLAAGCGNAPITDALMVRGASLGARSSRGASPIAFASAGGAGSLEALRVLLAHGSCTPALVKQLGFRSRSPLVLAVINHGHVPTIQALVQHGADPSETCATMAGVSVLHSCAHLARVDAMRCLIDAGAQVNAAAEDGISVLQECFVQTPTRQHSEAAKRQMFQMLVAAGADVNASTPEREYTVAHFALASCREEATATLLLESAVDLSKAVNVPVGLGDDGSRNTLLHLSAMRGWALFASRLVDAGADLQARNKDGLLPLHSAVLGSHAATVSALLAKGADPLALGPNCYPSFAQWKLRRGLQAMQAVMQGGGPLGPALLGEGPEDEGAPRLTAVDTACCVARHIPTVEAFLEHGVRPSPAALALAEQAVPLMRAIVERPFLTPELAARLPPRFRASARGVLLCLARPTRTRDGDNVSLTPDAVAAVLQRAAFPVSSWANPAWLAAQAVHLPPPRAQPAGNAQQPAPGGAQGGGLPAPGLHIIGPGEDVPPFVQQVMAEVAAQLGAAGAHPQFMVIQQPHDGQQAGGGGGGAGGAGAGAALGGGPGGGLQLLHHGQLAQQGGGGDHLHIMQFQIPPGGLPGMAPQQQQQPGQAPPPPFPLQMHMHIHLGGAMGGPFGGPAGLFGGPQLELNFGDMLWGGDGDEEGEPEEEEGPLGPFGGLPFGVPLFGGPLFAPEEMSDTDDDDGDEEEGDDEYVNAEEEPPAPAAAALAGRTAQASAAPPPPSAGAGPSAAAAAAVTSAAQTAAGQPDEAGPSGEGSKRPAQRYNLRDRAPKRQRRD